MQIEEISKRITAAVRPQLDALEALHDQLMPMSARVIGKHHPEYDTVPGRLNYATRRLQRLLDSVTHPHRQLGLGGLLNRLEVRCPEPDCNYEDSGYDFDLIMADYRKHRNECKHRRAPGILVAL